MQRQAIVFVLIILIFGACERNAQEIVVARLGRQTISLLEFRLAYTELLKQPNVFDSRALREQFLNELVNRRLLAQEAQIKGFAQNEKLHALIEAYQEKVLREAHYKKVIEPRIKIDSAEVKAIYAYTRQQRKLKHLFFKTRARADSAYLLLQKGIPWDSLARKTFKGTVLAETGGELGWVHWDQMEYEMAMAAFGQQKGTFTKPVKSTYGYHILLVEDLKIDPFVTEEEFRLHKGKIIKLVRAKKGQALARDYIEQMMKDVKIKVRPRTLQMLGEKLGKIFRRKPSSWDQMKTFQLNDPEVHSLERSLWDVRNEIVAYVNGQPLTVKKFIYALNFVPYHAVYQGLKTALDFVIRDQVLTSEARSMHLQKQYRFVPLKVRIYRDYLIQLNFRKRMAQQVRLTENDLRHYYLSHREQFGKLPFDSLKTFLQKTVKNERRIQRMKTVIDSLRHRQNIELFPERIHQYYDRLINNDQSKG